MTTNNSFTTREQTMTAAEIRQAFMDFFQSKGHQIVPSAPVVIKNDPTLLFTNAGMNQFKDYFLGNKPAPNPRVADTQKCLRVSGKHNDLEEVGVDTYHHTLFEMLGNWSFGDYFKKDAIAWSWELLTEVYGIDKERVYVTVFEGDEKEALPKDEEAFTEWKNWISEDRILMGNKKDNFWEMGDTGPCGPCTEIHVDCRSNEERQQVEGKTLVNNDHPQVIEIWNNVFMQFNRVWADKKAFDEWVITNPNAAKEEKAQKVVEFTKLIELPAKHVDTGMGLERLVRVLQGKTSNYDTDLFTGTITEIEKLTGKKYDYSDSKEAIAFRVLSDHIRAICFTIADGQLPSNTGAGYVIRRILRRAVRYYYSYLDRKEPLLHLLVPVLAQQFENVFPELQQQLDFVSKVVLEEENTFLQTLAKGIRRFENILVIMVISREKRLEKAITDKLSHAEIREIFEEPLIFSGESAFELHDTYGFPLDLTQLLVNEWNPKISISPDYIIGEPFIKQPVLFINVKGFEEELQQQKNRSRAATAIDAGDWVVLEDEPVKFVGYDNLQASTNLLKYRKVAAKGREVYQLVLATTPFYAESGGQVGDTGQLMSDDLLPSALSPSIYSDGRGETITITDTKKEGDLIIQFADALPENVTGNFTAVVDKTKRQHTSVHHSATHLLHAALRFVLGTHVAQKGSLVNDGYLRFDFSHFAKMTDEEIQQVETMVNEKIRQNIPVVIKQLPKEEALKLGAMALFGEKYGDVVRVVIMDEHYSVELCGGTHVDHTGELGFFKIRQETAVAAGVRRIEAVAGLAAEVLINTQLHELHEAKLLLKNPKEFAKAIEQLQQENTELKKSAEKLEAKALTAITQELLYQRQNVAETAFIGSIIEVSNADSLKKICLQLQPRLTAPYAVVLAANIGGKAAVAVMYAEALVHVKKLDAVKTIKEQITPIIKGGGGGKNTLATAGGQDVSNLPAVIEAVKSLL